MRAHSTIDRNCSSVYDDKPCPTWMKSLEDKYKRLHMKILFNKSSLGCNSRASGASSTISGAATKNTGKYMRLSRRLRATPLRVPEPVNPKLGKITQFQEVFINNAFENVNIGETSPSEIDLTNNICSTDVKSKEISEVKPPTSDMDYNDITDITPVQTAIHKRKNSMAFLVNNHGKKHDKSNRHGLSHTVKSCPPSINFKSSSGPPEDSRTEHGRLPRKKASKLFQKMSKEAQIAISETMSETMSEKIKDKYKVGREHTCLFNNYANMMRTSRTELHAPNHLANGVVRLSRARSCDALSSINSGSISSLNNRKMSQTRLPDISCSKTEATSKHLRQQNVLLPGVGRYQIPIKREQTFQITGAEYDIRYREVINCERRDSITPPSDILDQAIVKCQEWLTKYAIFAKR